MAKSYHAILGISADAGHEEVKTAYRRLAKQYHPDHEGGDSSKFRDIQEAYSVLADSEKRREYQRNRRAGSVRVRTSPVRRPGPLHFNAEPLIPGQGQTYAPAAGPGPALGVSDPAGEDIFEWLLRNFF